MRIRDLLAGSLLLLFGSYHLTAANHLPPGIDEIEHLMPFLKSACSMVRDSPEIWPVRSFPYGPLGLEVRNPKSASEVEQIRNFHLGIVAAACGISPDAATAAFFCGPGCPANRRDHLVRQMTSIRSLAASFDDLTRIRLLSVWAPRGEMRVNDVYLLEGKVLEAIPSTKLGLVPSGDWKPWESLVAYLATLKVDENVVEQLADHMRAIGLSAVIRDDVGIRMVGVGVGDNESGLMLLHEGSPVPRPGALLPDGRKYAIVEEVAPRVFYYETT